MKTTKKPKPDDLTIIQERAVAALQVVAKSEVSLNEALLPSWCLQLVAELRRSRLVEKAAKHLHKTICNPEALPTDRAEALFNLGSALHENRKRRGKR